MTISVVHQAPPNPHAASENRRTLDGHGVTCLSLLGAPGAGKTALLEAILPRIRSELNVAVLAADLAGTSDVQRIGALGVPAVQVLTDEQCHLTANQVQRGIAELPLSKLDLLIIENGGSLACQSRTDLGEHLRVTVASVADGHLVVSKYPLAFRDVALVLLTKCDLLPHVSFDLDGTLRMLARVNPGGEVVCTDARRRMGIDRVAGWLLGYLRAQRMRRLRRSRAAEPVWLPT